MSENFISKSSSGVCEAVEAVTEKANDGNEEVSEEVSIVYEEIMQVESKEMSDVDKIVSKDTNEEVSEEVSIVYEEIMQVKSKGTIGMDEVVSERITRAYDVPVGSATVEITSVNEEEEIEEAEEESDGKVTRRRTIRNEKYRFVCDLTKTVEAIEKEDKDGRRPLKYPEDLPNEQGLHFEAKHKYFVQKYIRFQEKNIIAFITETLSKTAYSSAFDVCKQPLIEMYKPDEYSEKGFVNFCAVVAYLGVYCCNKGLDSQARLKSRNFLYDLLSEVLARGPLSDSSW